MGSLEKLYTVEDIAKMTRLTTRTIRNYLKNKTLKGRKIGGQWRFSESDLQEFLNHSRFEKEAAEMINQDIKDFIAGVNTDCSGEIQTCSIIDYYTEDIAKAEDTTRQIRQAVQQTDYYENVKFDYHYLSKENKARYTLFGPPPAIAKAMGVIEEEWRRLTASAAAFSGKAGNYEKARPAYAQALYDFLYHDMGLNEDSLIAELGSGTGKMTRALLERGSTVFGIEPNADMRETAENALKSFGERFISIKSLAENIPLPAGSVDYIVAAQSYHYFDPLKTSAECKRILKDEGYVFLIWNTFPHNDYMTAIQNNLGQYHKTVQGHQRRLSYEEMADNLFGHYRSISFDNGFDEDLQGFITGALSASYAPDQDGPDCPPYIEGLKEIFRNYSHNGQIKTNMQTVCFYGKL